jgi:hypothetical protein
MVHFKTKATTKNFPAREQWKWQFVLGLYERGYTEGSNHPAISVNRLDDDPARRLTKSI